MKYRKIIHDAWVLTQSNKKLIWWFAFVPALLTTLIAMGYLSYQFLAFWTSPYFRAQAANEESISHVIVEKIKMVIETEPTIAVILVIIAAVVALLYLMLPVFTQGALIQLLARARNGHPISIMEGISFGFTRFLQLFEYHLLVKTFSLVGIFTEAAFVLRNLGPQAFEVFGWIFLLILLVGLFLTLLFTYSEYYIVIDQRGVFNSIISSSGLVVRNWHHTIFMFFLIAIISVRIVINILVALIIPVLVLAPIFFFASITLATIGVIIGVIAGLIALYFASYFLGVFHVFVTGVWTFTFLELTSKVHGSDDLRGEAQLEESEHEEVDENEGEDAL